MIWCQGRNSRITVPMIGVRPMPPPTSTWKPSSPASFLQQVQADVVPAGRGAVFRGAGDGDLELARQEGELGVQRAPLAQDFAEGARVGDLVDGDAGALVAGDVADAVAAGLDAVHVDAGQQVHHVGALDQRNPVELHVLARREVAVADFRWERPSRRRASAPGRARPAWPARPEDLGLGLVVFAGDLGQHAQLAAGQLAVGHRDAQHRRVALDVPAVLQAQRAELVVARACRPGCARAGRGTGRRGC